VATLVNLAYNFRYSGNSSITDSADKTGNDGRGTRQPSYMLNAIYFGANDCSFAGPFVSTYKELTTASAKKKKKRSRRVFFDVDHIEIGFVVTNDVIHQ
jgi:hypothetical protein